MNIFFINGDEWLSYHRNHLFPLDWRWLSYHRNHLFPLDWNIQSRGNK